jgi:hypothetical protein
MFSVPTPALTPRSTCVNLGQNQKQISGGHAMLHAKDNRRLTESGAGTGELPDADGTPKKIAVLGEELLAFRDSRGVVGIIDQYCPHRVRSGACVTSKARDLPAVMLERFGDVAGFVGRRKIAAAE